MSAALQILTREYARERALASLGLPRDATDLDVQLELLRAMTWALTGGRNPVHVLRLLNRSLEIASGFVRSSAETEVRRASLREALDALAGVGDLIELDGGLWVPAPTRLVETRRDEQALLVGGIPTRLVPTEVSASLSHSGPFRFVDRRVASVMSLPTEDLFEWARRPPEPLDAWAQRILALEIPDYSKPRDGSVTQLYIPEHARTGAPQFNRWADRYDDVTGTFLARRSRAFGAREYRVVEAAAGRLVRSGAVLAPREARRLMYAFDARRGNPTRARWSPRSAGGTLVLTSELPEPEHRVLGAMGRLELNTEKIYERRWTFSSQGEQVLELLRELSIDVRDDGKARR